MGYEYTRGHPKDYDYWPVQEDTKNGFYPVPKGRGTYCWNGERIVPKDKCLPIQQSIKELK